MWVESLIKLIRVQSKRGEVRLVPGQPVELPDDEGQQLLDQAGAKVRVVEAPKNRMEADTANPDTSDVWIDPPYPTSREVYWLSGGRILGPAVIQHVAKSGSASREQFWLIITYQGADRWVNADLLRSRKEFASQPARLGQSR